jgi:hypothetical protein
MSSIPHSFLRSHIQENTADETTGSVDHVRSGAGDRTRSQHTRSAAGSGTHGAAALRRVSRIRPGRPAKLIAQNIPNPASMCYDSGANQLVIPMNANNAMAFIPLT